MKYEGGPMLGVTMEGPALVSLETSRFAEEVRRGGITCEAQPIVQLAAGRILGYELLARGPAGSSWESPVQLLREAERRMALTQVDEVCRRALIEQGRALSEKGLLFVNVHPQSIISGAGNGVLAPDELVRLGLRPDRIVLEITESHAIEDFAAFERSLRPLRDLGYQVALDDFGAGYAGLATLIAVRPRFLKIDRSIVANVREDAFARDLLYHVLELARTTLMIVVAEGIETEEQLHELTVLGVEYGQGYFLGRPGPVSLDRGVAAEALRVVSRSRRSRVLSLSEPTIGEICEPAVSVDAEERCSAVYRMLEARQEAPGIVVQRGGRPVGLVMRSALMHRLSGQFGFSLYQNRPISMLMDLSPLVVAPTMPLLEVNRMAMKRGEERLYDLVLVSEAHLLMGIISVQRLMEATTAIQMRRAAYANPLTGLPGNVPIEQTLQRFVVEERPFVLVFVDLDNFKAFNDLYGFAAGDEMIRITADLLSEVFTGEPWQETLVGHVGGDDFVVLSRDPDVRAACYGLPQAFGRRAAELFTAQHRQRGSFPGADRDGVAHNFPLTQVTVVALAVEPGGYSSAEQVAALAAHLKTKTKRQKRLTDAAPDHRIVTAHLFAALGRGSPKPA